MKIAIITEILSGRSGSRVAVELAANLAEHHHVHLFAYDHHTEPITIQYLKKQGVNFTLFPYHRPFHFYRIRPILALARRLRSGRYDIILSFSFLPFMVSAWLSGLPVIHTFQGLQLDAWLEKYLPEQKPSWYDHWLNKLFNKLIIWREQIFFAIADREVAISRFAQKQAEKTFHCPMSQIYIGVDSHLTRQSNVKTAKNHSFTFLSVSRLTPYKGFHSVIKAFSHIHQRYPNVSLIILGSAPKNNYLQYLRRLAGKTSNIVIHTELNDKTLKEFYKKSHVYLTADRYLYFGLPVLEAAWFGLPTIGLKHAALPETVVHGKTGYIADTLADMVIYMEKLIKQPNLAANLGQQAQKRAITLFTWKRSAKQYEKLINNLLKK
jgi:glycosyltransferase involved in cell wall biosynthesis